MNADIQAKIKDFPKSLAEQRHITKVMVPRLLAQVIHQNPQIISAGVQSFYTRTTQFKVSPEIPGPREKYTDCRNFASSSILFLKIG